MMRIVALLLQHLSIASMLAACSRPSSGKLSDAVGPSATIDAIDPMNERIINGETVSPPRKYPWHVGIKFKRTQNYICGGSLISDSYVLTAAHCFIRWEELSPVSAEEIIVGVGDYNMRSSVDDVDKITSFLQVQSITIHKYFCYPLFFNNDIAVLKIERYASFSEFGSVNPICLPEEDFPVKDGVTAILTGWGKLNTNGLQPDKLQEASLTVWNAGCPVNGSVNHRICTKVVDGQDACVGDSGGPLVIQNASIYVQIGIVSHSFHWYCGLTGQYLVHTKVSAYIDWIKENTKNITCLVN